MTGVTASQGVSISRASAEDHNFSDVNISQDQEWGGEHLNIGLLHITGGVTVRVTDGSPLTVTAINVLIDGVLDASGSGHPGPASAGNAVGDDGTGLGPGIGGDGCSRGGGGAGNGGVGGIGEFSGGGGQAGSAIEWNPLSTDLGSSGGAGGGCPQGCGGWGGAGGDGGGLVSIHAQNVIRVSGSIIADGIEGQCNTCNGESGAGGGGGAGGIVFLSGSIVEVPGVVQAAGGSGASCDAGKGKGGGGGGGVVVVHQESKTDPAGSIDLVGGAGGSIGLNDGFEGVFIHEGRPHVEILVPQMSDEVSGDVVISYRLTDAESDTCKIAVDFQILDHETVFPATASQGSSTNVPSSDTGMIHEFVWDSWADVDKIRSVVGQSYATVVLGITPNDGVADGKLAYVIIDVDNSRYEPPEGGMADSDGGTATDDSKTDDGGVEYEDGGTGKTDPGCGCRMSSHNVDNLFLILLVLVVFSIRRTSRIR